MENKLQQETTEWYEKYYSERGEDRNDIIKNKGVLFQTLAFQRSVLKALRKIKEPTAMKVLDVGCGNGGGLLYFTQLGLKCERMYGIDIIETRITEAKNRIPIAHFVCGDAANMPYSDCEFDLVTESTMFIQLTDENLAKQIASEMFRCCRQDGFIMLIDWKFNFWKKEYKSVDVSRISELFSIGTKTSLVCQTDGALVPPLGRFLSKYCPAFYFLIQIFLPFLVVQNVTLLKKI